MGGANGLADEPHTRTPLLGATQTAVAEQIARYYDARQVLAAIGVEIRDEEGAGTSVGSFSR